jgi:hypothetical protein
LRFSTHVFQNAINAEIATAAGTIATVHADVRSSAQLPLTTQRIDLFRSL